MASNTEIPSGYDYEFVQVVPDDYTCVICHLVMRNPVQTKCGHRFCRDCLEVTIKRNPQCPVDRKTLTTQDIFDDVATERKILSLKIRCPEQGCDQQVELRDIENHEKQCQYKTVPCSYQNIGCGFKVKRKDLNDHVQNQTKHHLQIAMERIQTLTIESPPMMYKDDDMHYSYVWKVKDFSQQLETAKQSGRDIRLYSEPFYTHKYGYKLKLSLDPNGYGGGKGTHVSVFMVVMRGDYDAMLTWPFEWKVKFILVDQKPNPSQRRNIEMPTLTPGKYLDYFQRPTTDENKSIGYPQYVSHKTLATQKYVVDGTVFLKLELEKP